MMCLWYLVDSAINRCLSTLLKSLTPRHKNGNHYQFVFLPTYLLSFASCHFQDESWILVELCVYLIQQSNTENTFSIAASRAFNHLPIELKLLRVTASFNRLLKSSLVCVACNKNHLINDHVMCHYYYY